MQIGYDGFYVHIHVRHLDVRLLKLKMQSRVGESASFVFNWDWEKGQTGWLGSLQEFVLVL